MCGAAANESDSGSVNSLHRARVYTGRSAARESRRARLSPLPSCLVEVSVSDGLGDAMDRRTFRFTQTTCRAGTCGFSSHFRFFFYPYSFSEKHTQPDLAHTFGPVPKKNDAVAWLVGGERPHGQTADHAPRPRLYPSPACQTRRWAPARWSSPLKPHLRPPRALPHQPSTRP